MTSAGSLYGKSLYDLAAEENLTERIMEELTCVQELFREFPEYIRLLQEPSVPKRKGSAFWTRPLETRCSRIF